MSFANLIAAHRWQADRLGPRPALRGRRYGLFSDISWQDYREQALAAAAALVEAGVAVGDRVGLVSENRVEWLIVDMAVLTAGAVHVTPHAPLTAAQIHYQLDDADVEWLFVSTPAQRDKLMQVRSRLPRLRGIVALDACATGGEVRSWRGFLQEGRRALPRLHDELARREAALSRDSLATIMYTSGTTGNPKGVMLTHGNILSNTEALLANARIGMDDVVLSWLPFTHIYARTVDHYTRLLAGGLLCVAESADTLVRDLAEVQPTHMSSVPRFYEKVLTLTAHPDPAEQARRLRAVFGPRIDWLSSGGAPLPAPVAQAYHDAGLLVLQGYGLTETSPVISFNAKHAYKLATVGRPLPGVKVKIAADGEVLTRGPHVMQGYWKRPAETAETIRDGWLHTGDLGALDADGFLSITGRKKELLVMSSGKKMVPSYLEGLLQSDPCIDQAVVCGEGRSYLTALVVPHWGNVCAALREAGLELAEDPERLAGHPAVRRLLEERARAALIDVSPSEQVRKMHILTEPFSVAAGELTVSLKLRRNVVLERYARQIEAMYRE